MAAEPYTEADPVAILVQFLVAFGNVVGRGPHRMIGATPHRSNEFAVIVGTSSKGRKGTSFDSVEMMIRDIDQDWLEDRTVGGLSTGEGLINEVRDAKRGVGKGLAADAAPPPRYGRG